MANYWVDRFEQHAVHASLKAMSEALGEARRIDGDEGVEAARSRLELVADYVRRAVGTIDPFLASMPALDQIGAGLSSADAAVRAYVADSNPEHLTTANASADEIIQRLHVLMVPSVPASAVGLGESIATLRRSVDQALVSVRTQTERHATSLAELQTKIDSARAEVQAQIDTARTEITAEKARLDAALGQFQTQTSQAETARQAAFSESENQRQATATTAEEQRRTQFAAAVVERAKAFDAIKTEWSDLSAKWRASHEEEQKGHRDTFESSVASQKATFDGVVAQAREAVASWQASAKDSAEQAIADLESRKEEAKKLVHVIGNTGMTGGYQRVADAARTTANRWETIAVSAMTVVIAFALYAFFHAVDGEFKWGVFGARVFVAFACGVLGTYAATQSQKHREIERRNRKLELELASIDPYLASLPEEKRIEVKEHMADRFFGQALPESKEAPPMGGVLDVAKAAIETAGKVVDAVKQK